MRGKESERVNDCQSNENLKNKKILDIARHVYLTWLAGKAPTSAATTATASARDRQREQTKRRAYKFPTIFSHLNGEIVRGWSWLRWIWAARAALPASCCGLRCLELGQDKNAAKGMFCEGVSGVEGKTSSDWGIQRGLVTCIKQWQRYLWLKCNKISGRNKKSIGATLIQLQLWRSTRSKGFRM